MLTRPPLPVPELAYCARNIPELRHDKHLMSKLYPRLDVVMLEELIEENGVALRKVRVLDLGTETPEERVADAAWGSQGAP